MIDANGVDHVTGTYSATLSLAQEAKDLAEVQRLYSTLVNRAPTSVELQTWLQYYTSSGMNFTSLANAILSSSGVHEQIRQLKLDHQCRVCRANLPERTRPQRHHGGIV